VSYWDLKKKIIDVMRFMDEKGLNYGRAGNVSVRVDEDRVLITPSGVVKSAMLPEDILLVTMDGRVLEGGRKPTVEMPLHLTIYKSYKHVKAVIHAHSIYTSVLAVARLPLPPITEEMILYTGGEVRVAEFAPFGTIELAQSVVKALEGRSAAILANHGVVTVGRDLDEALETLLVVERSAQIYILSLLLGRAHTIPEDLVKHYQARFLEKISEARIEQ
jgi:L-fuculose-phosphate aldolase